MLPLPPCSTLFPYTTLFRSLGHQPLADDVAQRTRQALAHLLLLVLGEHAQDAVDGLAGADGVQRAVHHVRSEEHTSELQSRPHLVCRLLLEKKKKNTNIHNK